MMSLPIIEKFSEANLSAVLAHFPQTEFINHETRSQFSATFALHTRYFSNGDKPLVALVKATGHAVLTYDGKDYILKDGQFVFFDDNVPHSWIMRNSELEIFYYRQVGSTHQAVRHGDYCLDEFFV